MFIAFVAGIGLTVGVAVEIGVELGVAEGVGVVPGVGVGVATGVGVGLGGAAVPMRICTTPALNAEAQRLPSPSNSTATTCQ